MKENTLPISILEHERLHCPGRTYCRCVVVCDTLPPKLPGVVMSEWGTVFIICNGCDCVSVCVQVVREQGDSPAGIPLTWYIYVL